MIAELHGQALRTHAAAKYRDQHAVPFLHQLHEAHPFAPGPCGLEVLRLQSHHEHDLRGVDCMIDFRLIVRSVLVLQGEGREEYPVSIPLEPVAEIACQSAVRRLLQGIPQIRLLVADEHVVGLHFLRTRPDPRLYFVNVLRIAFVLLPYLRCRQRTGVPVISLVANGAVARAMAEQMPRDQTAIALLLDNLHTVLAHQPSPECGMLVRVLPQNVLVAPGSLLEGTLAAQLVCTLHPDQRFTRGDRALVQMPAIAAGDDILACRKEQLC